MISIIIILSIILAIFGKIRTVHSAPVLFGRISFQGKLGEGNLFLDLFLSTTRVFTAYAYLSAHGAFGVLYLKAFADNFVTNADTHRRTESDIKSLEFFFECISPKVIVSPNMR